MIIASLLSKKGVVTYLEKVEHFSEVLKATDVEAALAAGIFHRKEVPIEAVKKHLQEVGIEIR
jgi:glutamine amidotransferase/cyclase